MFVQDTFAEAKALGLTDGFVGTYSDLQALVFEATAPVDPDEDGSLAWARYVEGGWPGADQYRAEEEYDRQRAYWFAPADAPVFTEENDPDGEAENAWHEQQGERWAEAKASAWFAFPGDRH